MVELKRQLSAKSGASFDFWQVDPTSAFDSWWAPFKQAGWGSCVFDNSRSSQGTIHVTLRGSVIAAALAGSDQPVCHVYAGLFAGAASFFDRVERHGVEIQCSAENQDTCQFVIGPSSVVDSSETWRQQGLNAAAILDRLR
jgi:hypothetical protein